MTKAVAAQASPVQADALKKVASDPGGRRRLGQRLMRRAGREKHFTIGTTRPLVLDVVGKGRTGITGQRQSPFAIRFGTPGMNQTLVPINVLQAELAPLAAAKSQPG